MPSAVLKPDCSMQVHHRRSHQASRRTKLQEVLFSMMVDEPASNSTAPTAGPYKDWKEHVGEEGTVTLATPVFTVAKDVETAKEQLYVSVHLLHNTVLHDTLTVLIKYTRYYSRDILILITLKMAPQQKRARACVHVLEGTPCNRNNFPKNSDSFGSTRLPRRSDADTAQYGQSPQSTR